MGLTALCHVFFAVQFVGDYYSVCVWVGRFCLFESGQVHVSMFLVQSAQVSYFLHEFMDEIICWLFHQLSLTLESLWLDLGYYFSFWVCACGCVCVRVNLCMLVCACVLHFWISYLFSSLSLSVFIKCFFFFLVFFYIVVSLWYERILTRLTLFM